MVMDELTENARMTALTLVLEGIRAADPYKAVLSSLKGGNGVIVVGNHRIEYKGSVYVVGAGKATGGMAKAAEEVLGDAIAGGVISVPEELAGSVSHELKKIEVVGATHPRASEKSVEAGKRIVEVARRASEGDVVLALISGGGSALMEYPAEGVGIDDIGSISIELMKAGADIFELNTVRKHLSKIKGGWLAKHAYPAHVVALMISDVVGDRMDTIASGPTVPDPTTFADAKKILEKRGLWASSPEAVRSYIERGVRGEAPETPKPGDPVFERVFNKIVASNIISLRSMAEKAAGLGYRTIILTSMLEGEAREVGKVAASIAREAIRSGLPAQPPLVVLAGGETTVTVRGNGVGGRNQELALSAAIKIKGLKGVAIASVGSDGRDGPTDAAGAVVDGYTCAKAEEKGLDPLSFLENNDSYTFFSKVGGHVKTGYTGTNVNDFLIIVVEGEAGNKNREK